MSGHEGRGSRKVGCRLRPGFLSRTVRSWASIISGTGSQWRLNRSADMSGTACARLPVDGGLPPRFSSPAIPSSRRTALACHPPAARRQAGAAPTGRGAPAWSRCGPRNECCFVLACHGSRGRNECLGSGAMLTCTPAGSLWLASSSLIILLLPRCCVPLRSHQTNSRKGGRKKGLARW